MLSFLAHGYRQLQQQGHTHTATREQRVASRSRSDPALALQGWYRVLKELDRTGEVETFAAAAAEATAAADCQPVQPTPPALPAASTAAPSPPSPQTPKVDNDNSGDDNGGNGGDDDGDSNGGIDNDGDSSGGSDSTDDHIFSQGEDEDNQGNERNEVNEEQEENESAGELPFLFAPKDDVSVSFQIQNRLCFDVALIELKAPEDEAEM